MSKKPMIFFIPKRSLKNIIITLAVIIFIIVLVIASVKA